jgi:hypothetical protein
MENICNLGELKLDLMKLILTLAVLLTAHFSFSQKYSKVKIYASNAELGQLAAMGLPVDHGERKWDTYLVTDLSEDEILVLDQSGLPYEVVVNDVKTYYAAQNKQAGMVKNANCAGGGAANDISVPSNFETNSGNYAGFYTYQQMLDELDDMVAQYPNLISVRAPISTFLTWEGRPIYHVKISDNPGTNEAAETKTLYTGIHHAREPMSMSQLIFYMWYLLENYATSEEIQFLVNNSELYFVPCLNPDGYIHNETNDPGGFGMHRKNKRPVGTSNPGVDLNRNYSYQWGTTGVSFNVNDDTYPGGPNDGNDYSFSEPETQAIKWLVEQVGFTSSLNAHTYGNTLLFPIGSTENEFADHHDYFVELSNHMVLHNGYFPQKSSGLYPASGDADDYMYKVDIGVGNKDTIFVMTPEIGSAFWPAQSEVIPTCQGMVFTNMVMAHMPHRYMPVEDTDPGTIATMSGNFGHHAQRLGLEAGPVTVSIQPLMNIQTVGSPVVYDLEIREEVNGVIPFTLDPGISFGDEVVYVLQTEYPLWTKRDTIVKTYGALPLQFADDASNASNWSGTWITTGSTYVSPSSSFTDGNGDYQNDTDKIWTLDQSIDLTNATQAMITFYAKWEIEADYDYCQFQVSTNNGASWIGQCGNYTVEGINQGGWSGGVQPDGEPVYEGTQSSWVLEEIDMSDYLGETINVRFRLESDGGVRMDGFYFDDFQVLFSMDNLGLEAQSLDVKTFPNPANDAVTVSFSQALSNGQVEVYDQSGKIVLTKEIGEPTVNMQLDTRQIPQGMYTLRVLQANDQVNTYKLAIVH